MKTGKVKILGKGIIEDLELTLKCLCARTGK